jgi:hypothetical protein
MTSYYSPELPDGYNVTSPVTQTVLLALFGVVIAVGAAYTLVRWKQTGSPLGVVLLVGGVVASLNEALVNVAGLCWYPQSGQIVGYTTFLSIPLWSVMAYTSYFGVGTFVLFELARAGASERKLWIVLGGLLVSELIFEPVVIHFGGYRYFGHEPFSLAGMPPYWMATNFAGLFVAVALLLRMPQLFKGWRIVFAVLVPAVTFGLGSFATGWPIFNALHVEGAPPLLLNLAQLLTLAIGAAIAALGIRLTAVDGPRGRPDAVGSVDGQHGHRSLVQFDRKRKFRTLLARWP